MNPERIGAWWRRARDRAGVDGRWRLHDLRHWSATMSISRGHDIRTVANRLGHANPAMTLRVYAHAVESADGPVAAMLGQILDEAETDGTLPFWPSSNPPGSPRRPLDPVARGFQWIGVPSSSSMATLGITMRLPSLIAGSSPLATSS